MCARRRRRCGDLGSSPGRAIRSAGTGRRFAWKAKESWTFTPANAETRIAWCWISGSPSSRVAEDGYPGTSCLPCEACALGKYRPGCRPRSCGPHHGDPLTGFKRRRAWVIYLKIRPRLPASRFELLQLDLEQNEKAGPKKTILYHVAESPQGGCGHC